MRWVEKVPTLKLYLLKPKWTNIYINKTNHKKKKKKKKIGTTQECCTLPWTNPGNNTPKKKSSYMATSLQSHKPYNYKVHTISFQTFFVWAHLLIVYTWTPLKPQHSNPNPNPVKDDERCGRSKKANTPELIGQRVRVRVTMLRF